MLPRHCYGAAISAHCPMRRGFSGGNVLLPKRRGKLFGRPVIPGTPWVSSPSSVFGHIINALARQRQRSTGVWASFSGRQMMSKLFSAPLCTPADPRQWRKPRSRQMGGVHVAANAVCAPVPAWQYRRPYRHAEVSATFLAAPAPSARCLPDDVQPAVFTANCPRE